MRAPRRVLFLVLVALPLGGCAGLPFGASEEATAQELAPAAESAAQAWRSDAFLVAASAVEAVNRSDYADFPRAGDLFLDPAPGNGRAPFWVYLFLTPDGAAGVFTVPARTRAAVEVETHEPTRPSGHGTPPGVVAVPPRLDLAKLLDSDDAVQKARGDARFADALAALSKPAFLLHLEIDEGEDDRGAPRWSVFATGAAGGAAFARLHAETGAVEAAGPANASEVPGVGQRPKHMMTHEGKHDGTLTVTNAKTSHAIPVAEPGSGIRIYVCAGHSVPAGSVRVAVHAPGGEKIAESMPTGPGPSARVLEVPSTVKGDHRVELALVEPSAASDYAILVQVTTQGIPPEKPAVRC